MKICYINPTNNIRRPIAELAAILAEQGHHISIMYPQSAGCPTEQWQANSILKNPAITAIPIPSWYFSALRYSLPNIVQLFRETKKIFHDYDKVHIWEYYYPLSVLPLLLAAAHQEHRKKVILTTDGFVGYSYKPKKPWWLVPAFKAYTQLVARWLFRIPAKMTTYGQAMLPFAQQAGVPMEKIQVIPTGIHLQRFQNVNQIKNEELKEDFKKDFKKEFSITDEKIILFVGMLTERKGISTVIKVSSDLLDEGMNIKTILVGEAHGKNIYVSMVPDRHKTSIIFAGGRKDIPELMHLADVLFLPSEGEGLPGVVMEAMAAGLPVVATKEGCTPDLITNGHNGFLISDGQYKTALQKILSEKKLHHQFKILSQQKIKEVSWDSIAPAYLSLYQR